MKEMCIMSSWSNSHRGGWTEELHFLSFVPALLAAMNKKALSLFVGFAGLYKLTGKGKKD